jgi:hypothetical protein
MGWVLEESQTRGEERLVLLAIANHADPQGGAAWPSIAQIAREANVYPDTAKRLVRQLHNGGHVTRHISASPDERIPRGKRPNLYVVTMDRDLIDKLREEREADRMGGSERPGVATTRGQNNPPRGGQNDPGVGGSEQPPKPSLVPSRNRPSTQTPRKDPFEADFEEWWSAYPRKIDKAVAKRAYAARRRAGAPAADLLTAAQRYAASRRGEEPKFTKHGSTFLNNGWAEWLPGGAVDGDRPVPAAGPRLREHVRDDTPRDREAARAGLRMLKGEA